MFTQCWEKKNCCILPVVLIVGVIWHPQGKFSDYFLHCRLFDIMAKCWEVSRTSPQRSTVAGIRAHIALSANSFSIFVPFCDTLCKRAFAMTPGHLAIIIIRSSSLSRLDVHKWILMLTQRPFMWLTVKSSHPLFGAGPRLVFEKVSSAIKISVDGTLGLRVGIREFGGSGLLRWISHDQVLPTLRGWTPRADSQSQQKGWGDWQN